MCVCVCVCVLNRPPSSECITACGGWRERVSVCLSVSDFVHT